jgi:hypothetical protein
MCHEEQNNERSGEGEGGKSVWEGEEREEKEAYSPIGVFVISIRKEVTVVTGEFNVVTFC